MLTSLFLFPVYMYSIPTWRISIYLFKLNLLSPAWVYDSIGLNKSTSYSCCMRPIDSFVHPLSIWSGHWPRSWFLSFSPLAFLLVYIVMMLMALVYNSCSSHVSGVCIPSRVLGVLAIKLWVCHTRMTGIWPICIGAINWNCWTFFTTNFWFSRKRFLDKYVVWWVCSLRQFDACS